MAGCRSLRNWKHCSLPINPRSGVSPRRRTERCTWEPAIVAACTKWMRAGSGCLVWTAEQPEIFATAVDSRGMVYAGTSPDGTCVPDRERQGHRILRTAGPIYLGDGFRAGWNTLCRHRRSGQNLPGLDRRQRERLFRKRPVEHHVARDRHRRPPAGGQRSEWHPVSSDGPNKAFVLYDANLPEIRSILPTGDGTIYVAALGGSTSKRSGNVNSQGAGHRRHDGHRARPPPSPSPIPARRRNRDRS